MPIERNTRRYISVIQWLNCGIYPRGTGFYFLTFSGRVQVDCVPQTYSHPVCSGNSFLDIKRSEREAVTYPLSRSEVKNAPYSCTSAWHWASLWWLSFAQLLRRLETVSCLSHSDYKLGFQGSPCYLLHPSTSATSHLVTACWVQQECSRLIFNSMTQQTPAGMCPLRQNNVDGK